MRKRLAMHFRSALLGIAFALGATIACAALAAEPDPTYFPALWAALQNDPLQPIPGEARPDFSEDIATRKSYAIPAFEIVGFDVLLNLSNRPCFSAAHQTYWVEVHWCGCICLVYADSTGVRRNRLVLDQSVYCTEIV